MRNLRRSARRHEAGVNSEDYFEFTPGQRVLTIEGFPGTVTTVEDGPHPGSEQYLVELDAGLGGGEYGPSELRPLPGEATAAHGGLTCPACGARGQTSSHVHESGASHYTCGVCTHTFDQRVWTGEVPSICPTPLLASKQAAVPVEAGTEHIASEDYPELGDILEERLPLPHSERIASRTASRPANAIDCWFCDGIGELLAEGGGAVECQACDGSGVLSPAEVRDIRGEASQGVVAGFWDRVLEPVADRMLKAQEESGYGTYDPETGAMASHDWCRFRKNRRCFYPKQLNEAATQQAGYAVWVPEDRGFCPREKWEDQKACPVSEPGPHSGDPNARLDATVPWEQGGQRWAFTAMADRSGIAEVDAVIEAFLNEPLGDWTCGGGSVRDLSDPSLSHGACQEVTEQFVEFAKAHGLKAYVTNTDLEEMGYQTSGVAQGEVLDDDGNVVTGHYSEHTVASVYLPGRALPVEVDFTASQYGYTDHPKVLAAGRVHLDVKDLTDKAPPKPQRAGEDLVEDLADMVDEHRQRRPKGGNPYSDANPYAAALREGEFTFHLTAAWRDVQQKASRIRSDGHIRVISASPTYLVGEVRGDTNIYQTTLMREPGTKRIAMWECGCAWAAYSWGRSGRWKKYEGRLCSHALALNYEGQSRGWVDEAEDRTAPGWRSDPSITVKVPGDYKRPEKGEWRVGSVEDEEFARPLSTDASLVEAPVLGMVRDMLGDGDQPNEVIATLVSLGVSDAPGIVATAMAFPVQVQVRGRIAPVLNIFPDGVEVAGIGKVPASECLYPSYHPTRGLNLSERRASKTAAQNTGCMVAIEVPPSIAEALHDQMAEHFGGDIEDVTQYHVTLAYPGSVDDCDTDDLRAAVQDWARRWGPMEGNLSGFGIFHQDASKVLYASVDIPGLERARDDLVDTLARFGIALPDDHGFTPHLTLKYGGEAEDMTPPDNLPEGAKGDFAVSEVAVVIGDDWRHVSLEQGWREDIGGGRDTAWGHLPFGAGEGEVIWAGPNSVTSAKDERFEGVGLKEDDDGWYVQTHRARSDSYPTPEDIPQSDVDFIESTGSLQAEAYMPAVAPHTFVGMPPAYQVCDVCDMMERHPIHPVHLHPEVFQVESSKEGASLYGPHSTPTHILVYRGLVLHPQNPEVLKAYERTLKNRGKTYAKAEADHEALTSGEVVDGVLAEGRLGEHWTESPHVAQTFATRFADDTGIPVLITAWLPREGKNQDFDPGPFWDEGEVNTGQGAPVEVERIELLDRSGESLFIEPFSYRQAGGPLRVTAELKDDPEPALPETTGDEEEAEQAASDFVGEATDVADDPDIGAPAAVVDEDPSERGEVIEPGDRRLAWLMSDSTPAQQQGDKEMNIADAAKAHLAKTALKDFTPAEQAQIIEEGSAEGVVARNLDDLDLADTHYAALEEALQAVEQGADDENWLL